MQIGNLFKGLTPPPKLYEQPNGLKLLIKKIAKTALNKDFETFIMHIAALKVFLAEMTIYSSQKA